MATKSPEVASSPDSNRQKLTRFNATCVAVALSVGLLALLISLLFGEALLLALGASPVMIEAMASVGMNLSGFEWDSCGMILKVG